MLGRSARQIRSMLRARSSVSLSTGQDVELTSQRYPDLRRKPFGQVGPSEIARFQAILDSNRVITDPTELDGYNTDWMRISRGQGQVVLKPKTTAEVSQILRYCSEQNLAVCPQGGNTGLVGGSIPVFDEVIVNTSLMNKIESLDINSSVVTVQAGVILEQLDRHLADHDLLVPLDLGAKGSCQIGGNVSTNAGGLRLLRYGSLQGSILGLEVVLPNGEILDCLSQLKKDNTGYHLKHLFIGSEGTLGFVTKVAIQCPPRPKAVNVAFLGMTSFESVLRTFKEARSNLGEILSSCEFIDAEAMKCVTGNLELTCPIDPQAFYMLIETSGSRSNHDEEKLTEFLEALMSDGTVVDGTVASSEAQIQKIWPLRERLAEALLRDGYCYKYDISLPLDVFYDSVIAMKERLGSRVIRCIGYGHVGDGNMHLNITTKEYDDQVMQLIEPFLYEWTSHHKGSISAEHEFASWFIMSREREPENPEDDITIPRAAMNKMIKELCPNTRVANDARELILNCSTEFIHLLSSESNEMCNNQLKKTISAEHVLMVRWNEG
ncbi:D-2-hydroxyglutarate dehydrogenase, mitochondrial-like isoform X2 [Tigriopus californicus]|uniref:D-2-hydroxyglutarate dehydrogenase, mitochondrial-like isoform X2 n=1 Tax=Tigriopus californicus TaxID=6832 RepID=UPI0027DA6D25|nr:D-2-hydroxyglutarate dehydrogenase, mitochondrial-like isoform X2 [Tigriopus californicus]